MQQPSVEMVYDTLAQIMQEGKIYQTSKGYFIVTPEYVHSLYYLFYNLLIHLLIISNFFLSHKQKMLKNLIDAEEVVHDHEIIVHMTMAIIPIQ